MPFQSKWTLEDKENVVLHYFVKGNNNSIAASKATGVPAETIRGWTKTAWWADMMREVKARHADRLDGKFTYMIDKLTAQMLDRIENGDEIYDSRRGTMVKRAMSGRDIGQVLDKIIEKRALLRGDPTSRAGSVSSEKQLENLQARLEEAGRKKAREMAAQAEDSENVEFLHDQSVQEKQKG